MYLSPDTKCIYLHQHSIKEIKQQHVLWGGWAVLVLVLCWMACINVVVCKKAISFQQTFIIIFVCMCVLCVYVAIK